MKHNKANKQFYDGYKTVKNSHHQATNVNSFNNLLNMNNT